MRSALANFPIQNAGHAGQALQRLLPQKTAQNAEAQREQMKQLLSLRPPTLYAAALAQWQAATPDAVSLTATTAGPLAIGLGNASPYEVGLTLHHTYGVPYLPGSALKGLARRVALAQLAQGGLSGEDLALLFGNADAAGYVTFWDGWMDAGTVQPLQLDTITVHHPQYYGSGKEWPTDFDDPTPVAFLSVRPDVAFQVRLSGPEGAQDWVRLAAQLLAYGLTHLGLGGKTNAGYGGFQVDELMVPLSAEQQAAAEQAKAAQEAEKLLGRIRAELKNAKAIRDDGPKLLQQLAALPLPAREQALQVVLEQAKKFGEDKFAKQAKKLLGDG